MEGVLRSLILMLIEKETCILVLVKFHVTSTIKIKSKIQGSTPELVCIPLKHGGVKIFIRGKILNSTQALGA